MVYREAGIPKAFPEVTHWGDKILEINLFKTVYDCGSIEAEKETFQQTRERLEKEWNRLPPKANGISEQLTNKVILLQS